MLVENRTGKTDKTLVIQCQREAFWFTTVQREVPAEYQARVFSIDYMGTVGPLPLGMALAGPMADWLGERPLLIGISVFHLAICAALLVS